MRNGELPKVYLGILQRHAAEVYFLSEDIQWDKSKGELYIVGQRRAAVDVQALCDHLDLILGPKVAEVVMNQHEFRQGKGNAETIHQKRPDATPQELVSFLTRVEALSGAGVTEVRLPETSSGVIDMEISNPCLKRHTGAAKSFLFSYWCGVFTQLLGKEFKIDYAVYDESRDLMKSRIVPK